MMIPPTGNPIWYGVRSMEIRSMEKAFSCAANGARFVRYRALPCLHVLRYAVRTSPETAQTQAGDAAVAKFVRTTLARAC